MSAVDAPPGIAFAGRAAGEFTARTRSRRLARRAFVYVLACGAITFAIAARRIYVPLIEVLLVAPLVCVSIAGVGFAVRRARLRVDRDGVWWGWDVGGFRMNRERMKAARAYRDAVALTPMRGSTWYLSRRDWDRFDELGRALRAAEIPFSAVDRRAPLQARLQSYGVVLDGLLVINAVAATLALAIASML